LKFSDAFRPRLQLPTGNPNNYLIPFSRYLSVIVWRNDCDGFLALVRVILVNCDKDHMFGALDDGGKLLSIREECVFRIFLMVGPLPIENR
jgi:hypothetical protein